jgi:predicted metal-dependent HD superfamily phosphohydrolase
MDSRCLTMYTSFHQFSASRHQNLVRAAFVAAEDHIEKQWTTDYQYHDISHTFRVVLAAEDLANDLSISDDDRSRLLIAAAFHDCGYFEDMNNHENIGARVAANFLQSQNAIARMINDVVYLIQATAVHARPATPVQALLRDADLHYLGSDEFVPRSNALRIEWEKTREIYFTDEGWIEQNIRFMQQHAFHTEAAKARFGAKKDENLEALLHALG